MQQQKLYVQEKNIFEVERYKQSARKKKSKA